jgi:hypothetical protein
VILGRLPVAPPRRARAADPPAESIDAAAKPENPGPAPADVLAAKPARRIEIEPVEGGLDELLKKLQ